MKTDAEALAAYFQAWRDGWPVWGGWFRDGDSWMRYGFGGSKRITHDTVLDIDPIDIQSLTGVLVVELAKNPSVLDSGLRRCLHRGLPGVVGLWLEVNK